MEQAEGKIMEIPKIQASNVEKKDIWIHTRADITIMRLIDRYAKSRNLNRSKAVREIIVEYLKGYDNTGK